MSGLSDLQCQAIVLAFGRALDAVVRPVTFTDADESLSVSALGFADVLLLHAGRFETFNDFFPELLASFVFFIWFIEFSLIWI